MRNIQPFINAAWHTVPLKGKLERLEDGSKTTPMFEPNWKAKYTEHFNEEPTELGGAITGSVSNIVAIDCDDQATYELFKALDPEHDFVFISKGKPEGGATIIYRYGDSIPDTFRIHSDTLQLDFYNADGFIYLPTAANKTKHTLDTIPALKPMPVTVRKLLVNLQELYLASKARATVQSPLISNYRSLRPMVETLVNRKMMDKSMAALTPKDFRSLTAYQSKGWLHPNEVPDGRGSEYLSKISAILGRDPSVDEDLYVQAIETINSLWSSPVNHSRLQATIIKPMISGQATIDGTPIWQFDPDWESKGFSFMSKAGELYEGFYDDKRVQWMFLNLADNSLKTFDNQTNAFTFVDNTANTRQKRQELIAKLPIVRAIASPHMTEGFLDTHPRQYNMFVRTKALSILQSPLTYEDYKYPEVTIQFLHSLIPDDYTRDYVLSWLKYKLKTFSYSPVILYLLGASGSGKDSFVQLLRLFMGPNTFAKPSPTEFVSQFNGWLEHAYFVHCDEYGDQLDRSQATIAKGKLKTFTGASSVQIRNLHQQAYETSHSATFILTANTNPLEFDQDDRRFVYIATPNKLADQGWVHALGGTAVVHDRLMKEINDFAFWLATEVKDLSHADYTTPPMTKEKASMITNSLPPVTRFMRLVKAKDWATLDNMLTEHGLSLGEVVDYKSRMRFDKLVEVLAPLYPGRLTTQVVTKAAQACDLMTYRSSMRLEGVIKHVIYLQADGAYEHAQMRPFTSEEGEF